MKQVLLLLLWVSVMVNGVQRRSSYPFISGDTFRSICHHIVDETNRTINPSQVKKGDLVFVRTHDLGFFIHTYFSRIKEPFILITHNSDHSPVYQDCSFYPHPTPQFEWLLNDGRIIAWFAQNVDYVHPKLKPIPIGFANSHYVHGNPFIFQQAIQQMPTWQQRTHDKIYLFFGVGSNRGHREPLWQYLSQKSFCEKPGYTKDLAAYLSILKRYLFVISPRGNGLDCHRTWEALIMGAIPICEDSTLNPLYKNLPVICIDDWKNLSLEWLHQKYKELSQRSFKMEKLYADYWVKKIQKYRERSLQ